MVESNNSWAQVTTLMHKQTGVLLSAEQAYLLESRLKSIAQTYKFSSIHEFVSAACAKPPSDKMNLALVDAMTTHESYFFRDAFFWDYVGTHILPALKRAGRQKLRIWSAACSYGQEAYSFLMLLKELAPDLFANVSVYASDISEGAIQRGRAGIYSSVEVNRGLSAIRLLKYSDKTPGGFQMKSELREKIQWVNESILTTGHSANKFDVVLCRNVLIYFDNKDRQIALKNLLDSTNISGYIGLGTSEALLKPQVAAGWYLLEKPPTGENK